MNKFTDLIITIIREINGIIYPRNYYTISLSLNSLLKTIPYITDYNLYKKISSEEISIYSQEDIDFKSKSIALREFVSLLPKEISLYVYDKENTIGDKLLDSCIDS
jgi:hypothetical protein